MARATGKDGRAHRIVCSDADARDNWFMTAFEDVALQKAGEFDRSMPCAPHTVEFSDDGGQTWQPLSTDRIEEGQ